MNFKKILTSAFRGAQKGVRKVENEAMKKLLMQFALAAIRHALTAGGVSIATVSNDQITQLIAAGIAFAGLAWSFYRKLQAARALAP